MTKYVAKELKENVNVSRVSPVRDFFELVLKIVGVLLVLYFVLGLVVDIIAPRISIDTERRLSALFTYEYKGKAPSVAQARVQQVLDKLIAEAPEVPPFEYRVYIRPDKDSNALALPGGHIAVFQGLLDEVASENELAMVLGHELGHFVHRDHLRGFGRGLVFLLLTSVLFGADSSVSKFVTNALTSVEMKFSQKQERAADEFALELLNRTYGHITGALDFYEKMNQREKYGRFLYFFATHPYPQDRIERLKSEIAIKGYAAGEKIVLEFKQ